MAIPSQEAELKLYSLSRLKYFGCPFKIISRDSLVPSEDTEAQTVALFLLLPEQHTDTVLLALRRIFDFGFESQMKAVSSTFINTEGRTVP